MLDLRKPTVWTPMDEPPDPELDLVEKEVEAELWHNFSEEEYGEFGGVEAAYINLDLSEYDNVISLVCWVADMVKRVRDGGSVLDPKSGLSLCPKCAQVVDMKRHVPWYCTGVKL